MNVNELLDDPRVGLIIADLPPGSYNTLLESVTIRFELYTSRAHVKKVMDSIREEIEPYKAKFNDYVLNEILYEWRKVKGSPPSFEELVLKNWITKTISRRGEDVGLQLHKLVTESRKRRG